MNPLGRPHSMWSLEAGPTIAMGCGWSGRRLIGLLPETWPAARPIPQWRPPALFPTGEGNSMRNFTDEIHQAMKLAAEYEDASDLAFSRGDPIAGAQFFRWSVLVYQLAGCLERREAVSRLASH